MNRVNSIPDTYVQQKTIKKLQFFWAVYEFNTEIKVEAYSEPCQTSKMEHFFKYENTDMVIKVVLKHIQECQEGNLIYFLASRFQLKALEVS